jgi:phage host-nuclease inhibitor protein Gam
MARMKPKNSITSKPQAEAAMSKLNQIDQQLASWDLDEATAIAAIRDEHQAAQRAAGRPGLEAEKALLVKELEGWASEDSCNWPKKTMETAFGALGFRVGNPAVVLVKKVAKTMKRALELLDEYAPEYVRDSPEVDKEAILASARDKTLNVERLARCGLAVKQEDEFWIETTASQDLEAAAQKLRAA